MITHWRVQRLLEYSQDEHLVTSGYFNLDRSKLPAQLLRIRIKDLLHAADRELAQKTATHAQRESLREDFRLIEDELLRVLQLTSHRGLAIFSCSARKFWQVYPLPRMFRNLLVADRTPYVRPLLAILERYRRFGVLLLDRMQGRLFEFYMGELVERSEIITPLPRHGAAGGFGGREERSRQRHYMATAHQHYSRLAAALLELQKVTQFDGLILGGPADVLREFKHHLHPYLRPRWVGDFPADSARLSLAEVRAAVENVEEQVRWRQELTRAEELVQRAAAGQRAVSGLQPTLEAVLRGEAQTLMVEDGYESPGQICPQCQYLSVTTEVCPYCERAMQPCADVVAELISVALQKNCRLEQIHSGSPLHAVGRIGALLRFQPAAGAALAQPGAELAEQPFPTASRV